MISIRRTTVAATAAVLLPLGALSACSADDISEKVAEKVIENEIGEDADVNIDTDNGEVTIEDGDGNSYSSTGELPDDFPDDVPLVSGQILAASSINQGSDRGWTVAMTVDAAAADGFEEAGNLLNDAGFEGEILASSLTGQFSNDSYDVVVVGFDNGDGTAALSYTVGVK